MEEQQGHQVVASRADRAGTQLQRLITSAVTNGVGPLTDSQTYAESRLKAEEARAEGVTEWAEMPAYAPGSAPAEEALRRVVRESVAAAGTSGFVTGLGGLIAMPVTLPANLAGSLVINARMVGAVAHLRGYALEDPHTQAMLTMVVAGSSAQAALSAFGVKIGQEATKQAIRAVSMETIRMINKKAGFYLVAKYGTKRATLTLAKAVPLAGGLVGGAVDASMTRSIASVAKKVFPAA